MGIEGFCEAVAAEVAPFGIGITIVEPGGARTEFRCGSAQTAPPMRMSITKAAQADHDEPFPGHRSTLQVTDPEFVELFDNFAFDKVIAHGKLPVQTRLKVILAALIAMQTVSEYR